MSSSSGNSRQRNDDDTLVRMNKKQKASYLKFLKKEEKRISADIKKYKSLKRELKDLRGMIATLDVQHNGRHHRF